MSEVQNKLKLIGIKTKSKFYVSDNVEGESYHYTRIKDYFFDGEKPKATYHKDWFELKSKPSKIEKRLPEKIVNKRYELKEGFQVTRLTPKVIYESYIDEDSEFYEVKGLYDYKYETIPSEFEEIPFEINTIEEIDGEFEIAKMEFNVKHNLIDRIQTHPILLQNKPCYLSKKDSYEIIREHVKSNINPKYAKITSDYDFCFTVEKKIDLHKTYEYMVDVNLFHKRRKPKYEKRYQSTRSIKVFEIAPKPYQDYPVVEEFKGKDYDDLKKNIEGYLNNLMEIINEPVVECAHCKGRGVVLNEN